MEVRPANARELEVWDDLVVTPGGGHVYQSMAWARHRAASGWRPHHLVAADGSAILALERRWPRHRRRERLPPARADPGRRRRGDGRTARARSRAGSAITGSTSSRPTRKFPQPPATRT